MGSGDLIKIAIVDDHAMMREGLIRQLKTEDQIEVVMEAKHGLDMLHQLGKAAILPDIAVVDINMPVMDGFALAGELKKNYPQIRTLVLTAYCSDYNIAVMINNGVGGYLLKDCAPSVFIKAIHAIYNTGHFYTELANEHMFRTLQGANLKAVNIPEREMEFLKLCCTELRYDQIANEMGISAHTLDGCRERLFDRLGVSSRIALVLFAMQAGIIVNEAYHPNNLKIKF